MSADIGIFELRTMKVADIQRNPRNPRRELVAGDPHYESIKRSIDTFGLLEPLVWNERTGRLIGGHQRLQVLNDEGVEEVPVAVVDLDEAEAEAAGVALNRITGEWDPSELAAVLRDINAESEALARATGYEENELQAALQRAAAEESMDQVAAEAQRELDAIQPPEQRKPDDDAGFSDPANRVLTGIPEIDDATDNEKMDAGPFAVRTDQASKVVICHTLGPDDRDRVNRAIDWYRADHADGSRVIPREEGLLAMLAEFEANHPEILEWTPDEGEADDDEPDDDDDDDEQEAEEPV